MVLTKSLSASILYDLAMTMAGQTEPRALTSAMLQRLMVHTSSACGAFVLHPQATKRVSSPELYVAIGNRALHKMQGKIANWSTGLMAGNDGESKDGWFPGGGKYHHALSIEAPAMGCFLLFSVSPIQQASQSKQLLTPIANKFARALKLCMENEANAQALAQSEARFRGMLESTSDWIWEIDAGAAITFSSNSVSDLLGYTAEETVGLSLFSLMAASESKGAQWVFKKIAGENSAFYSLENVFRNKHGGELVLESSGVPIFDPQGELTGYRGISRDVTTRRLAMNEIIQAREAAESANRAKSVFLSGISHDLRTPLNAILGYAQLIQIEEKQSRETVAKAGEILQAGDSLLGLLNSVLDFARVESRGAELQIETFPVSEVIDACVKQYADAASWKKLPVTCDRVCKQCSVTADRMSMIEVLSSLLSNAIRSNHEGGEISVFCDAQNDRLRIGVTDTGTEIGPFHRAGLGAGSTAGASPGLASVRLKVERMGGRVWVESKPGAGNTFWIEMPSSTAECHELTGEVPAQPKEVDKPLPQGIRVLVAEDFPPNQILLKTQLTMLGCEVDVASDGAEALDMWAKARYDLVLTDLNMPVMDGLSLTRAICQQEAGKAHHTPVICITAADSRVEYDRCLAAGVVDTLSKPIALDGLRDALTRWTRLADSQEEDTVLDLERLYRILGEVNLNLGRQLVTTFIESARNGLEQLGAGNDCGAVAQEMHKQKSSASTVGAMRYAKLAVELEQKAKASEDGADLAATLDSLRDALGAVEAALSEQGKETPVDLLRPSVPDGFNSLLVVDDDPVVLQQMSHMLATLGVKRVLTASNGFEALKLLNEHNGELDALICDLNMPGMDGVELIRLFGRTGFKGGLILMSGAGEKVLSTVGKLADLQGLRVLGQLAKPVTTMQISSLLYHALPPRVPKRPHAVTAHVTSESIREGIDKDEFTIWFQPKVDAITLKPVGVEALARWHHPVHGILLPDTFIGIAEQDGLIGELSQILASKALMQGALMHAAGFPLNIALNLSGRWLDDLALPDFILATTKAAKLQPGDVILEVTETGVMKDLATALDVLTRLRLKGFALSIDDFGIGYSSLEQLDRIPFTELKLDRSFVSKGAQDSTARAILQSSMDMARRMALSTVAEGVETDEDLNTVREIGCDRVQGFLIAKPMTIDPLIAWLRRSRNDRASA